MEIITGIEQGSQEWIDLRLGKVTASKFSDVLAKGKGLTRRSYMMQLVAERSTGLQQASFNSSAMEWGKETEPQARSMYEFISDNKVEVCAFIIYDEFIGSSPDALIGDDGLLEIKCPNTATQLKRYLNGEFPSEYKAQVQGNLWVSQRKWCDFVSFDPRIDGAANYFCVRVERDEEYIANLELSIDIFLEEMLSLIENLN